MGSLFPPQPHEPRSSDWEPEPLHIEAPEPRPQRPDSPGPGGEHEGTPSDLPGSHVVVIDVA